MVSDDSAVDISFAVISGERLRAGEAERERMLKRMGAGIAVALLHVLFLLVLLTAGHFAVIHHKVLPKETILYLPPLPQHARDVSPPAQQQTPAAKPAEDVTRPHTITLPAPQTEAKPQTDVMQAIGKELACGAGPYEHLTQAEREACKRQPWKFKKTAKGTIVLDKTLNLEEPNTSGADAALHEQQTSDPCVAAGNTHSECIHKTIFGR